MKICRFHRWVVAKLTWETGFVIIYKETIDIFYMLDCWPPLNRVIINSINGCMCVSAHGWVCGYVDINKGGCEGAWVRADASIYVIFLWVSKEKNRWPLNLFFFFFFFLHVSSFWWRFSRLFFFLYLLSISIHFFQDLKNKM